MLSNIHKGIVSLLTLLFVSSATPSAFAQGNIFEGGASNANRSYTFYVLFLDYMSNENSNVIELGIDLKFATEGQVYQVGAMIGNITRAFSYIGPSMLTFFREQANAKGETIRVPMVSADLGKSGTKLVVVVRRQDGRLNAKAMDIDRSNFRDGNVRVVNFSSQEIMSKVGDNSARLSAMQSHDYPVTGKHKKFLVRLAIAAFDGEESYIIENRRFAVRKNGRKLIVLHHSPNKPEKVIYTSFSLPEQSIVSNYSDEEVKDLDKSTLQGVSSYGNPNE
ncbi:hypothetical protein [Rubellicoccus peritrichatus]|uniref:Uncharacterized protein n=1 Tax=Rubellicoccus peritrichatus TaxID=3080537 RepID=A0AAQ3L772_9BACT|nr:hypothetical protein [Puniceicoccus sp. CR14]WOO40859.1 hypothetical protein RZN69_19725 [Puniceicoccus sp. CR14]